METLVALIGGAVVAAGIARATGLTPVPFYLAAGFLLSLRPGPPAPVVTDILVIGATFLLFSAGIELTPSRTRHRWRAALAVGGVQFLLLGGAGFGVALAFGFAREAAIYLGLALAASSTLVGVRVLRRRREVFDPVGRLTLGVLLFQDFLVVLSIPLLAVFLAPESGEGLGIPGLLEVPPGTASGLFTFAGTLLLLGAAHLLHRELPRMLARRGQLPDAESWLLGTVALLFLFIGAGTVLGVPEAAAAFLAGYALSGFPVAGIVRPQLDSVSDFFTALFFTALGASVGTPALRELELALVLIALLLAITPVAVALLASRAGFSLRTALLTGLLLSQTSELSLILGLHGVEAGVLGDEVFTLLVIVTAVSMLLTPLLATDRVVGVLLRLQHRRFEPGELPPDGHVLLVGCGSNGAELLDVLLTEGQAVTVIDVDPSVIRRLSEAGVRARVGDASDPELLSWASPERARAVVSTLRRVEDNAQLLDRMKGLAVQVLVRTFGAQEEEWVRDRGGVPVAYDRATASDLEDWLEESGLFPELEPPETAIPGTESLRGAESERREES